MCQIVTRVKNFPKQISDRWTCTFPYPPLRKTVGYDFKEKEWKEVRRVFLAIEPDPPFKKRLEQIQNEINPVLNSSRMVNPELFHITLQFFGQITEDEMVKLIEHVKEWPLHIESFPIFTSSLGMFKRHHTKTLWVGLQPSQPLNDLADQVFSMMEVFGEKESRPFKPHITLARDAIFRSLEDERAYGFMQIPLLSFTTSAISLMESRRTGNQLHYPVIMHKSICG